MLDAAEKSGKLLTIGYQTRQTAQAQYLKAESDLNKYSEKAESFSLSFFVEDTL